MTRGHCWFRAVILAGLLLVSAPALAAEAGREATPSGMLLYKTLTYQALSTLGAYAYGDLFAGGAAVGGLLAVASTGTEPLLYYVHEWAWSKAAPHLTDRPGELVPVKTTTYAVLDAARSFAIGLAVTGSATLAGGFLAFHVVTDAASYVVNDLGWLYFMPQDRAGASGARTVASN